MKLRIGVLIGALIMAAGIARPCSAESGLELSSGQTVYVPVYSHIYAGPKSRPVNLTVMVSIRNTDMQRPITITVVDYYNSEGLKIKSYLDKPRTLPPLATTHFIVEEYDSTGGSGANFIVRWESNQPANIPILEGVHISTRSGQGISFVTRGVPTRDKRD